MRWAADYVVTTDTNTGEARGRGLRAPHVRDGRAGLPGADVPSQDGGDATGGFRVLGGIGRAARLRGLGRATGTIDERGRPVISGKGSFRLADSPRVRARQVRCGPLRRLAPQRG